MDFKRMMLLVAVGLVVMTIADATVAPKGTTAAPKGTTAAPKGTTAAPKATTAAPKATTAAPKATTAAPKATTAAPKATTAAPKATTAAPKATTKGTTAAPKATTTAPKATKKGTTAAPKATTTKNTIEVLSGVMDLEVTDKYVMQTEPHVVKALRRAMSDLIPTPLENIEITSITDGAWASTSRRLDAQGNVKVAFKVADPSNKVTPKQVAGIAPNLPGATNAKLAALTAGPVPTQVGKATIATPTKTTKPRDPCAVVVTAAPASPCAPVTTTKKAGWQWPWARKFEEQADINQQSPFLPAMVGFAVMGLIGMVFLGYKVRRHQTRDTSIYSTMKAGDLEDLVE